MSHILCAVGQLDEFIAWINRVFGVFGVFGVIWETLQKSSVGSTVIKALTDTQMQRTSRPRGFASASR